MASVSYFVRCAATIALLIGASQQLSIPSRTDIPFRNGLASHNARAADGTRPLYLIAHKVLTNQSVDAALKNGANALEMDMTAWDEGWWADHDGTKSSRQELAGNLFNYVAQQKKSKGGNIQFVWLDIKNADYCDLDDKKSEVCSIKGLQSLARSILEPAGVAVLYGFMKSDGKAFPYVRDSLGDREAINYDGSGYHGSPNKTPEQTNEDLSTLPAAKKVASYGSDKLNEGFGNCHEASWNTCTEMRMAAASGNYTKSFGWTVVEGQADLVAKLFGDAKVDGVIYGHESDIYSDDKWTESAMSDIQDWIKGHPETRVASIGDAAPW